MQSVEGKIVLCVVIFLTGVVVGRTGATKEALQDTKSFATYQKKYEETINKMTTSQDKILSNFREAAEITKEAQGLAAQCLEKRKEMMEKVEKHMKEFHGSQ